MGEVREACDCRRVTSVTRRPSAGAATVGASLPRTNERLLILRTFSADSRVTKVVRRLLSNKKVQLLLNGGLGLGLLAVSLLSARHFMHAGWPLHHADPILVAGAAGLFLLAY